MVKKGELFNAYSSYFNILENVGQYPQADANRLILLSFLEQMKADGYYSSLSEEDRKTVDKIIECIRKKLCILPYTSTCMKKKAEKVYIGEYEDCIFYNKTVPQYEDMNANWQLQTVYCVKNSQNYNNGRKVTVWQNTNSLFKGPQTKTEEVIDISSCPYNAPNWVEQSRSCEQTGGLNTGYALVLYKDTNVNSSTYGHTKTEKVIDTTTCPLPNTDPMWVEVSRACNTANYDYSDNPDIAHTTGYATVVERDANPNSSSYGEERVFHNVLDSDCPFETVGYLTYSNGQLTKTVSSNSAAYSITLPLVYHINDVLEDPWHDNVKPFAGDLNIQPHDEDCTVTISAPKNTTGKTRTLVNTIGAYDFDGYITFTLIQSADAIFQWNDTTGYENATAAGWVRTFNVTSTAGGEFHAYQVLGYTAGISASISGTTVTVTVAQNTQTVSTTKMLKLKQKDSNIEIMLMVAQAAAEQPQPVPVFSVSPASLTFNSGGGTQILTVTSTIDNVATEFTYVNNFNNATVTRNGNTITVVANSTSSTVDLSGNIVFTQNTSLETVTVPVTQTAPNYVFTWQGGSTADKDLGTPLTPLSDQGIVQSYSIVSTKNGLNQPFIVSSTSTARLFADANIGTNFAEIEVYENKNKAGKSGYFLFRQTDSGKELTVNIVQEGSQVPFDIMPINKGLGTQNLDVQSFIDDDPDSEEFASINMIAEETVNLDIPRDGYVLFSKNVTANNKDCNSNAKYSISEICPNGEDYINITFR